jgi:hypothetical protein
MDVTAAHEFLNDQFPVRDRALLPPAFKAAYSAVAAVVRDTPFLNVPSAAFNRGRLLTWAVDHAVEGLIKAGRWNVDYRWRTFGAPKPTGAYIEILLAHSKMTISQVADPSQQPRNVQFRENARLFNSPLLPFDELRDESRVTGRPSLLLIHGHQDLTFIYGAMPHAVRQKAFICRTSNILALPQEVAPTGPPVEDTTFRDTLTLKTEIEKWLRDNNG